MLFLTISKGRFILVDGIEVGSLTKARMRAGQLVRLIYKIWGKPYHLKGEVPDSFYLARASREQREQIEKIFSNRCERRYTEVIFSPELKMKFPGKEGSIVGKFDSFLSLDAPFFSWIARQQSFHTFKK